MRFSPKVQTKFICSFRKSLRMVRKYVSYEVRQTQRRFFGDLSEIRVSSDELCEIPQSNGFYVERNTCQPKFVGSFREISDYSIFTSF